MAHPDENETPELVFLASNKNKRVLSIDDYVYYQNKFTEKVSYWICQEKMCWAGVHLDANDRFIKFTKHEHNHMPMPEQVEVRKLISNVKNRVHDETMAIGQIYNEELAKANLSKSALVIAGTARGASKQIFSPQTNPKIFPIDSGFNKTRRATTPNLPSSIDFDIPSNYKKTNNGERYLLADRVQRCDGEVNNRIIVFATDEQLKTLFTSPHIMMDGTFDSSPSHFAQVYSIHGMKNDHSKLFS